MNKFTILKSLLALFLLIGCASNTKNISQENQKNVKIVQPTKVVKNKINTNKDIEKIKEKILIKREIKAKAIIKKELKSDLIILGEIEYVYIKLINAQLKARIDTGATTTSINALNIKSFERDGKKWVKFDLLDENKKVYKKSLPIYEIIQVKRHGVEDQKRYVVKMRINLGTSSQLIRVSLTNRSKFTYPVLVGRNLLRGIALVDVSQKYTKAPVKSMK